MTAADWLIAAATLCSPLIAVQVQKYLDRLREQRGRRLYLFHTLMATRGQRTSVEHVRALNMIDIEYCGSWNMRAFQQSKAEKRVTDAWASYRQQLNTFPRREAEEQEPEAKAHYDELVRRWGQRKDELFIEVLEALSRSLGYEFTKPQLESGLYTPEAHGTDALKDLMIKDGLAAVLSGDRPLGVALPANEADAKSWSDLRSALTDFLRQAAQSKNA